MVAVSRASFLKSVEQADLLTVEQIQQVESACGEGADAGRLAHEFVGRGLLTSWQTEQLLDGHTSFFLGRYLLLEQLGQGGSAVVYKARQSRGMGRTVVLKVVSRQRLTKTVAVSRFLREMRAVAALHHPNIVSAFDADHVGSTYFLVMEFLPGSDLRKWLRDFGRLPVDWSCECIRQAALGLEHAHSQGMIHRDIKPSNLMIDAEDTVTIPHVKILDLGIARFITGLKGTTIITKAGQVLGTADYMSPEQARNAHDVDVRADIYSLGCTLFHALTGELPFTGNTVAEKLLARIHLSPPQARSLRNEIPPEVDQIVSRMIARNPDDRFSTAAEVAAALAPYCLSTRATLPGLRALPNIDAEPAPAESVDLLSLVSLPEDAVSGNWHSKDGRLYGEGDARLQIPYIPPAEYTLHLTVARQAGQGDLALGIVLGSKQTVMRIHPPSLLPGQELRTGKTTQIECRVRTDQVVLRCDGEEIVNLRVDAGTLPAQSEWALPHADVLFLGCWGRYEVSEARLEPLAEGGRPLRGAEEKSGKT